MQTIQGIQQPQLQMTDRPIMPVVSMSAQSASTQQQVQQTLQQAMQSATMPQGINLQSNLAVTQQTMPMGMQQIHPVRTIICLLDPKLMISFVDKIVNRGGLCLS